MRWDWSRARRAVYATLGGAIMLTGGLVQVRGGVDRAGPRLLGVFGALAGLMGLLVVVDTAVHAWIGRGQACRRCGHVRPSRSFRLQGPCPECGEG